MSRNSAIISWLWVFYLEVWEPLALYVRRHSCRLVGHATYDPNLQKSYDHCPYCSAKLQ